VRGILLAALVASATLVLTGPAGAGEGSFPARLTGVGPDAALLNTDQAKIGHALSKHPDWNAVASDCLTLQKDTFTVDDGPRPTNKSLNGAWRSMLAGTLGYADACVNWAESHGIKQRGDLSFWKGKLATEIQSWNTAVTLAANSAPSPTTTPPATTPASPPTQAQFESSCSELMPFAQLDQGSDAVQGVCVTEQGQVYEYDANTGLQTMLVNVTNEGGGTWDDLVEVDLPSAALGNGIAEGDIIQFWGPISGSDTYTTQGGGTNTVPVVNAMYLTLVSS
jgi:hypothetical protein